MREKMKERKKRAVVESKLLPLPTKYHSSSGRHRGIGGRRCLLRGYCPTLYNMPRPLPSLLLFFFFASTLAQVRWSSLFCASKKNKGRRENSYDEMLERLAPQPAPKKKPMLLFFLLFGFPLSACGSTRDNQVQAASELLRREKEREPADKMERKRDGGMSERFRGLFFPFSFFPLLPAIVFSSS